MTGEELLSRARKEMWAAWALSSDEIGSVAADALLSMGMLVEAGGAQELERLRVRVAELEADNAAPQEDKEYVASAAERRLSKADVAAWLSKKAREYPTAPERQESAPEAIARLASKVARGAIRPKVVSE